LKKWANLTRFALFRSVPCGGAPASGASSVCQIPTYEEGDLGLFETWAIVFHIAERHAGLVPVDANARARATTWMFAAVNTMEPPILEQPSLRQRLRAAYLYPDPGNRSSRKEPEQLWRRRNS
jgi:glutathione S-transferase